METLNVNYRLAVHSGYKANIVDIGRQEYDELAYFHKANFPDVEITRPTIPTDLRLLHDKCLMTVNGYVYPTEYYGDRLFIKGATEGMLKTRSNQLGILSFNQAETKLKKTQITEEMLNSDGDYPYYNKVLITFPEEVDSCILVLAGYLIFEQPEFFYRVSGSTFALRLDRLGYIEKLYELSRNRNIFETLGIEASVNNPSVFEVADAISDETIEKFLTLDNSFLVQVPGYLIDTRKVYLEHSNVPGNLRTEIEPTMPLFGGYGKVIEYKHRKNNDHKYTLQTIDSYMNNHLLSKLPLTNLTLYNDHREVGNTYQLSQAFFLDIQLTKYS